MQRWRLVAKAPGYEVSDDGEFRKQGSKSVLSTVLSQDGITTVRPTVNGTQTALSLGRLVLEAFAGLPDYAKAQPLKAIPRYKDNSPANCELENLLWIPKKGALPAYAAKKASKKKKIKDFCKRFDNASCPNKEYIESMLYEFAGRRGVKGNLLSITGPNVSRHIGNAFGNIIDGRNGVMAIVEINPDHFIEMTKALKGELAFQKRKIRLMLMDVVDLETSYVFEDIDLMCTLKVGLPVHLTRLSRQSENFSTNQLKAYIFTCSLRNGGGEGKTIENLNEILHVLDAHVTGFDGQEMRFSKLVNMAPRFSKGHIMPQGPNFEERGRIDALSVFKYADSSDMLTGLITYH